MSTESVYVSSASNVSAAEVRRRKAQAREARRRVAQERADRLAAEAARRRISAANDRVAREESVFNEAVARLDEAASRLPDLVFKVPALPSLAVGESAAPDAVESYADRVAAAVSQIVQQIDTAIAAAEIALQRRLAIAAAWREIQDRESTMIACAASIAELEKRLAVSASTIEYPAQPAAEAELETLQAYLGELQMTLGALRKRRESLESQENSRIRARNLSGAELQAVDAGAVHTEQQARELDKTRAQRRAAVQCVLSQHGLSLDRLGEATRLLVQGAVEETSTLDRLEQIERWIAREKQHVEGINKALILMQRIPDHVHEDARLSERWLRLTSRLQRVANGIDEFLPDLDREYCQIEADAERNLVTAYTKAGWVCAMSRQGFRVLEPEEGGELVVVDLNNPDVWLRATEMQAEDGGFAVMMELETDAEKSESQEAQITDSVCHRLGQVKDAKSPKVNAQGEILARARRITRRKRPPTVVRQYSANFE